MLDRESNFQFSKTKADEFLPWYYKKLLWKDREGRKLYEGNFLACFPDCSVKVNIQFWAHRPTLAMREITKRLNTEGWEAVRLLEREVIN